MTEVNIYPNLKKTIKIVKARIGVFNYIINTSADISAQLMDENDLPIETRILHIDGEDFAQWGTDDAYLISWVKTKLQEGNN